MSWFRAFLCALGIIGVLLVGLFLVFLVYPDFVYE